MRAGWPIAMLNLLAVIVAMVGPISRELHCVEYFSGVGQIAKAFREAGHNSRTFDIIDLGDLQNLTLLKVWQQPLYMRSHWFHAGLPTGQTSAPRGSFCHEARRGEDLAECGGFQGVLTSLRMWLSPMLQPSA